MMRALPLVFVALLAVSAVSGARVSTELLAPAPAPAASKPVADLLFTLSAANATFPAADRLELSGLQTTAQAFNTETRATGIYGLGTFANTSAASPFAAAWAGAPDAVMYAAANGSRVGALLALSQPAFDAAAGKLTFAVRLVPAESAALALAGGASARAADDAANGLGSTLLTEIPVGGALTSAALFIDLSSMQVGPAASTKDCYSCGGGGWGGGGGGWGGNNWGGSWGGNSGWDQSYQQPNQQTNINNNNVVQNQGWNNSPTNINNNNVQNNGWNGGNTNINNNNVAGNGNNGNTNINNNNVGNSGTNINNNNAGGK